MRMNTRKLAPGNRNIAGAHVTEARSAAGMLQKGLLARFQVAGVEISHPALSLLERQERPVSDIEFKALSEILNIDVRWLLGQILNLQRGKIHIIAVNPLKLSAGPCFSQKVI